MTDDENHLLIRVDERVKALDEKLDAVEARIVDKLDGGERRMNYHANRIRALERWVWGLAGGLALLGMLVKVFP